jgi:hypothetical protein
LELVVLLANDLVRLNNHQTGDDSVRSCNCGNAAIN